MWENICLSDFQVVLKFFHFTGMQASADET